MRYAFQKNYKFVAGQTSPEDLLTTTNYPATYIDVSGYEWVEVIIHLGNLDDGDTPVFEVFQSDTASGSLDTLDETNCKKTCVGTTDDDQMITMYIETATLLEDHHFITTACSGGTASYADIIYLLGGARHMPITQDTTMMPSDNQLMRAG